MTLEFAQSRHDAIDNAFVAKLDAINKAAFEPSALQQKVMSKFLDGAHRITFLTSSQADRMNLRPSQAAITLDELVDMGYMSFYPAQQKYALVKKGRDFMDLLNAPVITGIKTPPRTYLNSTMPERLIGVRMPVRDGGDDNLLIKSLPMRAQISRVGA